MAKAKPRRVVRKAKPRRKPAKVARVSAKQRAAKAAEVKEGLEAEERRLHDLADQQEATVAETRRAAEEIKKHRSFLDYFR